MRNLRSFAPANDNDLAEAGRQVKAPRYPLTEELYVQRTASSTEPSRATHPTCMCPPGVSARRKAESSGESRCME